jgi:60 kDa SS-A/Ro ribonucleoprotein
MRAAPQFAIELDQALLAAINELPELTGNTAVLVDVSGSMDEKLSAKSDLTRMDAAATLSSMIRGSLRVFTFSNELKEVPPYRGMAGVSAIVNSQQHGATRLFEAVAALSKAIQYDRLIVITDEQATGAAVNFSNFGWGGRIHGNVSSMPDPNPGAIGYVINVASAKNGIGYGKWRHIDGFSEAVLRYIQASETLPS